MRRRPGGWVVAATTGAAFVAALAVLAGCDVIVERHCSGGEIVISNPDGGRNCEPRRADDRTCPGGQVLERQPELRRERCIPDRIDREVPSSTEWLPSTGD